MSEGEPTAKGGNSGGVQGLVGSGAGGAGVLGLFLALQSAGLIPSQPVEKPKTEAEIRQELERENAKAQLLEHVTQAAKSNAERLTQLVQVMENLEESISDLEKEGKRAEDHLKDTLNTEFGFLVQACFDDYAVQRRKKGRRSRTKPYKESEEEDETSP